MERPTVAAVFRRDARPVRPTSTGRVQSSTTCGTRCSGAWSRDVGSAHWSSRVVGELERDRGLDTSSVRPLTALPDVRDVLQAASDSRWRRIDHDLRRPAICQHVTTGFAIAVIPLRSRPLTHPL